MVAQEVLTHPSSSDEAPDESKPNLRLVRPELDTSAYLRLMSIAAVSLWPVVAYRVAGDGTEYRRRVDDMLTENNVSSYIVKLVEQGIISSEENTPKYREGLVGQSFTVQEDVTNETKEQIAIGDELGDRAVTVARGLGLVFREEFLEDAIRGTSILSDRIKCEQPVTVGSRPISMRKNASIGAEECTWKSLGMSPDYLPIRDLSSPDFEALVDKIVSDLAHARLIPGMPIITPISSAAMQEVA